MMTVDLVASNPFFGQQWYLNATGQQTEFDPSSPTRLQTLATTDNNVVAAWEQLATGLGVQIGIVSGGFDLNHPDLVEGFVTELATSVLGGTAGFTDGTDANGTALAGIIGARNNDEGIVGIAYNADLVPIRAIPGDNDTGLTRDASTDAMALRFRAGILGDENGDGILDGSDQLIDTDGDGLVDSFPADQVIDVYLVSGDLNTDDNAVVRDANFLDQQVLDAIAEGAQRGRATWVDTNGDGLYSPDEERALGSIYVVPAGDDAGTVFGAAVNPEFQDQGLQQSSQFDQLANSRFTIAVGAVPYDGRYEDNAIGTITSFSEVGANVLIVAPSSTGQVDIANPSERNLDSGILTTDISGPAGLNGPPIGFPFSNEIDGDFFPDVDYTSTFGGTEAAAAQVAAVVGQLLEVNPNLSRRDVELILLQSAQTNDQFSETWINNAYTYWQDPIDFDPRFGTGPLAGTSGLPNAFGNFEFPDYWAYLDIDTNGDGMPDISDAVIPNTPFLSSGFNPNVERGFFSSGSIAFDGFVYTDITDLVDSGVITFLNIARSALPDRIFILADNTPTGRQGEDELFSPADYRETPLLFANGAGFTISQGYGRYQEEVGYAHGLLDAGLAVELARTWGELGITRPDSVTVSTTVDVPATDFIIQPATASVDPVLSELIIPGGAAFGAGANDREDLLNNFRTPISTTDIVIGGVSVGEVITGGPFYDPDQNLTFLENRESSFVPIEFDQGLDITDVSIEWIELTLANVVGDIDHVRLSILSPDGTQSELTPFIQSPGALVGQPQFQFGQFQQGNVAPNAVGPPNPTDATNVSREILDQTLGGLGNTTVLDDFNDGSELPFIVAGERANALADGDSWTFSTNRHYGETLNTEASNPDNPAADVDGQWYLVIENWGPNAVNVNGLQVTFHGTEATGTRIQGKVGVDDNAQGIDFFNQPTVDGGATAINPTPEQLGDGVFNFNRYIEFGELIVDPTPTFDGNGFYRPSGDETVQTVVLDDESDAIPLDELQTTTLEAGGVEVSQARAYRTIDPDTGIESIFPIVNRDAYFNYDSDPLALGTLVDNLTEFDPAFATQFVNPSLRQTDGQFAGSFGDSFFGQFLISGQPGENGDEIFRDGEIQSVRNFDYSQESFAAGVVVEATQFRVSYNEFGIATERVATGDVQRFVTGADGNYYFDVESTPAPPDIFADPLGYGDWLNDFGETFEYVIEVVNEDDRLFNRAYKPDQQEDLGAQVTFAQKDLGGGDTRGVYDVRVFSDVNFQSGETISVEELNFVLAADGFEVSGTVTGVSPTGPTTSITTPLAGVTVFNDANNNGVQDAGEATAVTDATGAYEFLIRPVTSPETVIRVDTSTIPSDFELNNPTVTLSNVEADGQATVNFEAQAQFGFITGAIFDDLDGDGEFDFGEPGVDGTALGTDGVNPALFVFQDTNGNGEFDEGVDVQALVDAGGFYQFRFDTAGTFDLQLDVTNSDIVQTFPFAGGSQEITLGTNSEGTIVSVTGVLFGVVDLADTGGGGPGDPVQRTFDYGDLPDSYGTTLAAGGARHRFNNGDVFLGSTPPDSEPDGIASANADGDDLDGVADEDGVALVGANRNAGTGEIEELIFDVSLVGGGAVLNAFIDFNNNGQFDVDAGEHVLVDEGSLDIGGTTNTVVIPVPAGAGALDFYASRFRYGPTGLGPTGAANEGEVEDYLFAAPPVPPSAPAAALQGVAPPQLAAILDESLAVEQPAAPVTDNSLDNVLLEWSLEPVPVVADEEVEPLASNEETSNDEAATDLALAEVFAF